MVSNFICRMFEVVLDRMEAMALQTLLQVVEQHLSCMAHDILLKDFKIQFQPNRQILISRTKTSFQITDTKKRKILTSRFPSTFRQLIQMPSKYQISPIPGKVVCGPKHKFQRDLEVESYCKTSTVSVTAQQITTNLHNRVM